MGIFWWGDDTPEEVNTQWQDNQWQTDDNSQDKPWFFDRLKSKIFDQVVNPTNIKKAGDAIWSIDRWFWEKDLQAATNADDLAAQQEAYDEDKDTLEALWVVPTKRSWWMNLAWQMNPGLGIATNVVDSQRDWSKNADTTRWQNIWYNDNVKEIAHFMKDGWENSVYSKVNRAWDIGNEIIDMANKWNITQEEYNKLMEQNVVPVIKAFNSITDRSDLFNKEKDYDMSDIYKIMWLVDRYWNNLSKRKQYKDYTELEDKYKETPENTAKRDARFKESWWAANEANIDKTITKITKNIYNQEFGDDRKRMWNILDSTQLKYHTDAIKQKMYDDNRKYSSSISDLLEEKKWQEDNWHDKVANAIQKWIDQIKDIRDNQLNQDMEFYNYYINNVWRKWHQDMNQMTKQYEKNTGNNIKNMVYAKDENWLVSPFKVTTEDAVATTMHQLMALSNSMKTAKNVKWMSQWYWDVIKWLYSKDAWLVLWWSKKVLEDSIWTLINSYKTLVEWSSSIWHEMISKKLKPIVAYAIEPISAQLRNFKQDRWNPADTWREASDFSVSSNKKFLTNLENPLPWEGSFYKYSAVAWDATPIIVDKIAEFMATRKLWDLWAAKTAKYMKNLDEVEESSAVLKNILAKQDDIMKLAKQGKDLNRATRALESAMVNWFKNKDFGTALRLKSMAKMFQQSVLMDTIFHWWSTNKLSDTDAAIWLMFAWTLDLLDTIKQVKNVRRFAATDVSSKLLNSEEFVDAYAKKMLWDTKWFSEPREKLSDYKKNIARSQARWMIDLNLTNILRLKDKVDAKTWSEMTKMIDNMSNQKGMTEKLAKEWSNVVWETYKSLLEKLAKKDSLEWQKAIQSAIKEESEKAKYNKLTKEWDNYTYGRDKFVLEHHPDRSMNYFINNVLPQKWWMKLFDELTTITIDWKEFWINHLDNWKKYWNSLWKNVELIELSNPKNKANGALYISKNWNMNIALDKVDDVKKVLWWVPEFTKNGSKNVSNIKSPIKTSVEPKAAEITDTVTNAVADTAGKETLEATTKKWLVDDMEKQFRGYNTTVNTVSKKDYEKVADLLLKHKWYSEWFIKDLNKSDVNKYLKWYYNDVAKWDDLFKVSDKESNMYRKRYDRGIKSQLKSLDTDPKAKKYMTELGKDNMDKVMDVLLWWTYSSAKWLRKQLGKALNKDLSHLDADVLKRYLDIFSDTPVWKNGNTLAELYFKKNSKMAKSWAWLADLPLKAKSDIADSINDTLKKYSNDAKKFIDKKKVFDKLPTRTKQLEYLNNPHNEAFKEWYISLRTNKNMYDNLIKDTNITYKEYNKLKWSKFIEDVMDKQLKELDDSLHLWDMFSGKTTYERMLSLKTYINDLSSKELTEQEYLRLKEISERFWYLMPDDELKLLNKWLNKQKKILWIEDVTKEAEDIVKDMKSNKKETINTMIKEAEERHNLTKTEAKELVERNFDEEIQELESEIRTQKVVLWMKEETILPDQKIILWHSNKLTRSLFSQPKDYIGDKYFIDSDTYRNILSRYWILPDWSSLKSMISKNSDIVHWSKNVQRNEDFIRDMVAIRKGNPIPVERLKIEWYTDKLKQANEHVRNIYDDIADQLWWDLWDGFVKNTKMIWREPTEDSISKLWIMLEHWDWMEFIRYTDHDVYSAFKNNHDLVVKVRWEPASWKKTLLSNYTAKKTWAINILAHDSLDSRTAETIWSFTDKIFEAQRKYKNTQFSKWIKKDRVPDAIKDNKFYQMWKSFSNNPYVFSQTILHPAQLVQLTVMNGQSTIIDSVLKWVDNFTKKEISDIRKEYNLLIAPQEFSELKWWPLRQIMDWEVKWVKEWFDSVIDTANKVTKELTEVGPYNLIEVSFDSTFRNDAIRKSIIDITWESDMKWFKAYMAEAEKNWTKENILQAIRTRANEHYTIRNAVNFNVAEWKFMYGNPYTPLGKVQKVMWRAYHFLWSRWNQHMRNYFNMINNGNLNLRHMYAELQAQVGTNRAKELVKQYTHKNQDINNMIQKLVLSMSLWDKINQRILDPEDTSWFMERMWDAAKIWTMFYAWAQWLMSSPVWRNIIAVLQWVLLDDWYEHSELNDAFAWAIKWIEWIMSNMWRRTLTINSMVKALWQMDVSDEKWIADFVNHTYQNFVNDTEWYSFFLNEDVTTRWFAQRMPASTTSQAEWLYIELNEYKDEWTTLSTIQRLWILEQKIKDWWPSEFFKRMLYKLPLVKNYKFWQFQTSIQNDDLLNEIHRLPMWQKAMDWAYTDEYDNQEFADYTVSRLTEFLPKTWKKELSNWDIISQWYDDFRWKYVSKMWNMKRDLQNKENLFVKSMFDAMWEGKMLEYMNEFNKTDSDWVKAWLRLLWAVEALWNEADVPWASRTLMWAIASEVKSEYYFDSLYEAGYKYWEEPEDWSEKTRDKANMYVAKEFGNTLYVTDKDSWASMALYQAREHLPEYSFKFSWWDLKEWDEFYWSKTYTPVSLTYEHWQKDEKTGKESRWNDSMSTQLYKLDMYTNMEVQAWNHNAIDMFNALSTIFLPKNSTQAADPNYNRIVINWMADAAEFIENSNLSRQAKISLKNGIWLALAPIMSVAEDSKEIASAIWKDTIDWATNFIRWTVRETAHMSEDVINENAKRNAYKTAQKWWRKWPNHKTNTLMDHYDKDQDYRSNYFSTDYVKKWKKNYSSYKKLKSYAQSMSNIPYIWSKYSNSKSYRNDPMSKYLDYYYRFKDVKWWNVSVGGRGNKIARNFRTKPTKLMIPKVKK